MYHPVACEIFAHSREANKRVNQLFLPGGGGRRKKNLLETFSYLVIIRAE